jgi:hypothetical protein
LEKEEIPGYVLDDIRVDNITIEVRYIVLGRHLDETMTGYIDVGCSCVVAGNNVAIDTNIGIPDISKSYPPWLALLHWLS